MIRYKRPDGCWVIVVQVLALSGVRAFARTRNMTRLLLILAVTIACARLWPGGKWEVWRGGAQLAHVEWGGWRFTVLRLLATPLSLHHAAYALTSVTSSRKHYIRCARGLALYAVTLGESCGCVLPRYYCPASDDPPSRSHYRILRQLYNRKEKKVQVFCLFFYITKTNE